MKRELMRGRKERARIDRGLMLGVRKGEEADKGVGGGEKGNGGKGDETGEGGQQSLS
jgi:hypothetical protein